MVQQFASPAEVMLRALELAARGLGSVEPNPPVGAVLVDDELRCLGEGWHQHYGGPHAEVHALQGAGAAARGATLYVTLEPCCHFGKTPPCSQAVIAAGVRRVVAAMSDPAPHVGGKGFADLRTAGIEVTVGLEETAARRLTAPFVCLMLDRRPWVHAKWAMTLDGKIASRTGHSQWISSPASRAVVHLLRGRMDAILVGVGTALADDPLLTARPPGPRTPTRIVVDSHLRLPPAGQLARSRSAGPVIVVTTATADSERAEALSRSGVEVLRVAAAADGRPDLTALLTELGQRRMTNLLVEGGSAIHGAFHDAGLIDEVHAFIATKLVGGASAPSPMGGAGGETIPETSSLQHVELQTLDGDVYLRGVTRIPG